MPSWVADLLQPDRLLTVAFLLFFLWLTCRSAFRAFPFVASFVELVQTLVGDKDNPGIGHRMDAQVAKMSELRDTLETVRAQVQNSHSTNLRDDVDDVKHAISKVAGQLEEHIEIAKKYDAAQDETAKQVERLVSRWADET